MYKYGKILLCIMLCIAFLSCSASRGMLVKNWGKIMPNDQVKKDFESYQVSPDMNYFISGSDVYPNAILGLDKAYILDSTLWKKVDLNQASLKELVTYMKNRAIGFGQFQFGFAVLDDQGKQIGVWYSLLSASTGVKMKGDNKVMIYTPDQNTYERFEDGNVTEERKR
jgi:hypothetical protein